MKKVVLIAVLSAFGLSSIALAAPPNKMMGHKMAHRKMMGKMGGKMMGHKMGGKMMGHKKGGKMMGHKKPKM